jgi:hypothetical protein
MDGTYETNGTNAPVSPMSPMSPIGPIRAIAPDTLRLWTRASIPRGRLRGPLSPNRDFGEIQFLVADVDNAVVLEKEVSA